MTSLSEYNKQIELIRDEEFPSTKDVTYLDHAGTTLVAKQQLAAHHGDILHNLYGNPHSRCPSSQLTTDTIDQVRYRILQHFNAPADEYSVIFTSGCTASLKLVAESFDFHGNSCQGAEDRDNLDTPVYNSGTNNSSISCNEKHGCHGNCCGYPRLGSFVYLIDNHTSVQGMRELAFQHAGKVTCVSYDDLDQSFTDHYVYQHAKFQDVGGNHLFAFPAQSNFSGRKYLLNWISKVKHGSMGFQRSTEGQRSNCDQGRWYSLLDAAAFVSTSALDLGRNKPDFVTLSFYKMFGYPTGLGALLVRNEASHVLRKGYFGGGSVSVSLPTERFHVPRPALSDRFEDGTVSFLDIIAVRHGLDALEFLAGGMATISQHTFCLASYFHHHLKSCCHGNGRPLAEIYCVGDFENAEIQGPIVNFNLKRADGDYIGFSEVDKLAQLHGVHVRTGCFCNIGACQHYLHMTSRQVQENFHAGHVCGDDRDLIEGRPTGSVRVSFGYMSVLMDAQKCLEFIVDCFLEAPVKPVFWEKQTRTQSKPESDNHSENMSTKVSVNSKHENKLVSKSNDAINKDKQNIAEKFDIPSDSSKLMTRLLDVSSLLGKNCTNLSSQSDKSTKYIDGDATDVPICEPEAGNHILESSGSGELVPGNISSQGRQLTDIFVYPVKSCAAFKVSRWELSPRGLLYDRGWMVVTGSGVALSQKRDPALCLLQPSIDLHHGTLTLEYPGMKRCTVPLSLDNTTFGVTSLCNSKVCGDRVQSIDCGEEVADWLSEALQRPGCRLIRQQMDDQRECKLTKQQSHTGEDQPSGQLSLANESQYLLLNQASVERLREKIVERREAGEIFETYESENLLHRFRGNLVIDGFETFDEDSWQEIQIGNTRFKSEGGCTRCQMVCVDQQTAERSKEPLRTLAVWRGTKIPFGIHLRCINLDPDGRRTVEVGDPVTVLS